MKIKKAVVAIVASLGMAAAFAGCVDDTQTGTPGGDTGNEGGGKVTIGIKFDQPGLGLKVGEDYTGFDVEVAKYVAKELGYSEIEWKQAPSAQRETLLQSGQVQMIFATYSITDDRKQKVSFAGPYFVAGQGLLVRADNTDITGPDSLNGKKLCSVTGSTPAQKIKEEYAQQTQLEELDTYSKCVEALNAGRVDAVTTDDVILAGYAAQEQYAGKLKVVGKPFTEERYGVGIKKGDTELCTKINTAIEKMISEGAWKQALADTVGDSFAPDESKNPPKPDACS